MSKKLIPLLLSFVCVVLGEYYDTFTGVSITRRRYEEARAAGLLPWCAQEVASCDPRERRRMDLTCNNLQHPTRGTVATPYRRMLPANFNNGTVRTARSGLPLPPPRQLRVDLMSDGRISSTEHTQMIANFALLITGDVTSITSDTLSYIIPTNCCQPSGVNNSECAAIAVKDDDLHLRASNVRCLNLTWPITYQSLGCVGSDVPLERVNTASPLPDLSGVYGSSGNDAAQARLWERGEMRSDVIKGKDWPPDGSLFCVNNVPPKETRCHNSASSVVNGIIAFNLMSLWWFREHNALARSLLAINPCWDDDTLYYTAREINIAYLQQMFYYEFLPEIMGRDYLLENEIIFNTTGHVDDYDPSLEPRLSMEFVTGTRWFHTIQEGRLKLYDPKGVLFDEKEVVDYTLRTGALLFDNLLEGATQGAFRQPGAAVDAVVDPSIGERVLGRLQLVSDVIASDIMKSRLVGLAPYTSYRRACGLSVPSRFHDLHQWMDVQQVDVLAHHYESVDDIDIMVGLMVEKGEGAMVPPTLMCLMADQLRWWRRSDRFWFEHSTRPQAFTVEQLREIRKVTMAALMCDHGDTVTEIQRNVYLLPKHRSDILPCSAIVRPDLSVFRDAECAREITKQTRDPEPPEHGSQYTPRNPFVDYNEL